MSTARQCHQPAIGIDASRANSARRTGVEWYSYRLIQELKTVIPPSVRVVLYSPEPLRDGLEKLPAGWESRVLKWPPRRLWTQLRLSWEMIVRPPDLLFVPAHVLPVILPRRSAVTIHDVGFAAMPRAYGRWERLWQTWTTRRALRLADRVLTPSKFSRNEIGFLFKADLGKIAVTPLAPLAGDTRHETLDTRIDVLERYRLKKPYFLYVGRLEEKKNIAGLLAAFAEFKKSDQAGHSLALVGPNADSYPRFLNASNSQLLNFSTSQLLALGYVCPDDLSAIYKEATALVMPSFYEGFGLPVLEAYAAGTPAIVGGGSLPEVAGDGAIRVDPKDIQQIAGVMRRLASDPALRADLAAKGRARLADFSWQKTAELTWQALGPLVSGKCE